MPVSLTTFGQIPETPAVFDAFDETHGRPVRRLVFVTDDPDLIGALDGWPGLTKFVAVETIASVNHVHGGGRGKVSSDIRYFLTSEALEGPVPAAAVRNLWAIENSLHWVLDIGFREDDCRVRDQNAAANLPVIRKIAVNLVRADTSNKRSINGRHTATGWGNDYMHKIIGL